VTGSNGSDRSLRQSKHAAAYIEAIFSKTVSLLVGKTEEEGW